MNYAAARHPALARTRSCGYAPAMAGQLPTNEVARNKGFAQTHRDMIEAAVRLVSQKGAEAMSVAAVARELGISRANVYYHFANREALLAAVKDWASEQIARGMDTDWSVAERTAGLLRFALDNPELIKLWSDDLLAGVDIRSAYTSWDEFVGGLQARFDAEQSEAGMDAEVYGTIMLTTAYIAPRIFARCVRPDQPTERIVERFVQEQRRVLKRDGLDWDE